MKNLLLIWHSAGEELYKDRFLELSKKFKLTVFGFKKLQNTKFNLFYTEGYNLKLFDPIFSFHWLTIVSFKMLIEILKNKSDYVYIHEEPHSLLCFLILLFKKKNVTYILDSAVINRRLNFYRFNLFEKLVYRKIDIIFYRNNDVKKILLLRGAPYNKLKMQIGNGVSKRPFAPRKKIQTIGFAGKIIERKGLHLIIEAIKNTKKEFNLLVCGEILDFKYFNKLSKSFQYLGNFKTYEDMQKFYDKIDVLICPSISTPNWQEQFGRVLVEASVSGALIMGSTSGFIPNLTLDCTFNENDTNDLKVKLDLYSSNHNLLLNTIKLQRENIIEKYSWESITTSIELNISNNKNR